MIAEANQYSADDALKKRTAELRVNAETLIYTTRRIT